MNNPQMYKHRIEGELFFSSRLKVSIDILLHNTFTIMMHYGLGISTIDPSGYKVFFEMDIDDEDVYQRINSFMELLPDNYIDGNIWIDNICYIGQEIKTQLKTPL